MSLLWIVNVEGNEASRITDVCFDCSSNCCRQSNILACPCRLWCALQHACGHQRHRWWSLEWPWPGRTGRFRQFRSRSTCWLRVPTRTSSRRSCRPSREHVRRCLTSLGSSASPDTSPSTAAADSAAIITTVSWPPPDVLSTPVPVQCTQRGRQIYKFLAIICASGVRLESRHIINKLTN